MDPWQKIILLNSVDSTNNYFSDLLKSIWYPEGTIIAALYQNKGKGLGKNTWEGEKGKNLLLSLVLYPDFISVENQFLLSKIVSLGIVNYLELKTENVKIKWPNDIYFKDKKLAGILIENTIRDSKINQCILGIGLNLNQTIFSSNLPNPCSLSQLTGKKYSVEKEIIELRASIRHYYDKLRAGKKNEINSDYLKCLYRFNELSQFKSSEELFTAQITGVNNYGHLQVLTEDKMKKEFDLKEIEFVI